MKIFKVQSSSVILALSCERLNFYYFMQEEIWKDIKGYDGAYQVSNLGRVRSFYKRVGSCSYYKGNSPIILRNLLCNPGYYRVSLSKNGIFRQCLVHRLVAEAFIPNEHKYREVNHINGVKTDNYVENLEWCTRQQNAQHAFRTGLSRITDKQKKNAMRPVRLLYPDGTSQIVSSIKEASKIIGYAHYNSVYTALYRGRPLMNGFRFEYITKGQYDHTLIK